MKLNDEELRQYYAAQGIQRSDLLSAAPLTLAELPPDVQLTEAERREVLQIIALWNRLDDLEKIDATGAIERRVLKQRVAERGDAWAAFLHLGRIRNAQARQAVMEKIARGKMTPAEARPRKRARKVGPLPAGIAGHREAHRHGGDHD